jgi:transposase-like protein
MPRTPINIDPILTLSRWTPEEARAVLAALDASGLDVAAFARRHEVQAQRLYSWRRKLETTLATCSSTRPTFVEIAPRHTPGIATATRYELCLASGGTLRIEGEPSPGTVRTLLTVLREVDAC